MTSLNHPPDTPAVHERNLDSVLMRRCAHRIRTQSDAIAEALQRDAKGEVSVADAPEVVFEVMAELTAIHRELASLFRMANRAAEQAAGVQS